ncbi:MAG: OmpA family protein [Proteobacteria bacterium]|nr:OmpA family protein [Pseudomonadota bacterium]
MKTLRLWFIGTLGSFIWTLQPILANVTGSELQNFNAAYTSVDGATVHSARTLGRGRLNLGLFGNNAINTLPYFNQEGTDNPDQDKSFNNSVTGLEMDASYGISSFWDFSLALSSFVGQTVDNDSALHGYFARLGVTEIRFASKFNLIDSQSFALAVLGTANLNRLQNNPYSGNTTWPAYSAELLGTLNFAWLTWNTNFGYRWHKGEPDPEIKKILPIERFGDQLVASTGVEIDLPGTKLDLLAEIYGSYAQVDFSSFSPRNSSVLEGLVGGRYPLSDEWQVHAGYGAEMRHSISSADYRVYAGVRWMTDLMPKSQPSSGESSPAMAPTVLLAPEVPVSARVADAVIEMDDIYFQFNSSELSDPRASAVMQQLQSALQGERRVERVVIEGHACAIGSDDYNFDLSDHRAETIERWLMHNFGVAPEKLVTVAWGEKRPKASNLTESGRRLNRRVSFKIYYELPRITPAASAAGVVAQ